MGGAMRNRPNEDVILMFRKAFAENPVYALKCLFYLRDVRGGQGERRFFRLCINDLAKSDPEAVKRNLTLIPEYGRYDDLYALMGTPVEEDALGFFKTQLALDVTCKTPSLLAKWLKSENTSSAESRKLATKTRKFLGMTHKEYRKTLSYLRTKINIVEKLMSYIETLERLKSSIVVAGADIELGQLGAGDVSGADKMSDEAKEFLKMMKKSKGIE
jgi:hypothetical protein